MRGDMAWDYSLSSFLSPLSSKLCIVHYALCIEI